MKNTQDLLNETSNDLKQKNDSLADLRKRWKQAAMELDKLKSLQNRLPYQVTDSDMGNEVMQLRQNIRNFAFQYFGDELPSHNLIMNPMIRQCFMELVSTEDILPHYFSSKEKRPFIIQAYMWHVLWNDLFDQFLWAGGVKYAIRVLDERVHPGMFLFP